MVEKTLGKQNSDSGKPNNRLAATTAGFASQQSPQTSSAILRPTTTNALIFHGKNKKVELLEDFFHIMFQKQPEKKDAMGINHFLWNLRKEAL